MFFCIFYFSFYSTKIGLASLSLLIVIKVLISSKSHLSDNIVRMNEENKIKSKLKKFKEIIFGMWQSVFKKRPGWMTNCVIFQIMAYTLYYVSFGSGRLMYLYVRKALGWTQDEYISLKVLRKSLGICILIVLMPFLKRLKISDVNLLILFNFLHGAGFLVGSFSAICPPLIYIGIFSEDYILFNIS